MQVNRIINFLLARYVGKRLRIKGSESHSWKSSFKRSVPLILYRSNESPIKLIGARPKCCEELGLVLFVAFCAALSSGRGFTRSKRMWGTRGRLNVSGFSSPRARRINRDSVYPYRMASLPGIPNDLGRLVVASLSRGRARERRANGGARVRGHACVESASDVPGTPCRAFLPSSLSLSLLYLLAPLRIPRA